MPEFVVVIFHPVALLVTAVAWARIVKEGEEKVLKIGTSIQFYELNFTIRNGLFSHQYLRCNLRPVAVLSASKFASTSPSLSFLLSSFNSQLNSLSLARPTAITDLRNGKEMKRSEQENERERGGSLLGSWY